MVAKTLERRYNVATAFLLVVRKIGCIAVRCSSAGRRLIKKSLIKLKNFLRKLKKSLICVDKTAQMCVKYKYEIDLDTPLCNAYHVGVDFL